MADDGEAQHKRETNRIVMGAVAAVIVLFLVSTCSDTGSELAKQESSTQQPKLAAEVVAQCRDLLAKGEKLGLIKGRPEATRINVEDAMWAQLPADVKDRTMQAVSCDVWQTSMPPEGMNYVVAYGYRSGKRLQMLTDVGMSRE